MTNPTTARDEHQQPLAPPQLRYVLQQAEQAATLEDCALALQEVPEQHRHLCQQLLTKKAVAAYSTRGLEEVLEAPAVREYGLDREEIKQQIQQSYVRRLLEGFFQTQAAYSKIQELEPPQAMERYQAVLNNVEAINSLQQRFQEDFHLGTIYFGDGKTKEDLGQNLRQFAIEVNTQYLNFLVRELPNRELATDNFYDRYAEMKAAIERYTQTANLSEEQQGNLTTLLGGIEVNYRRFVESVRVEIEQEQDDRYQLCIITKAHEDQFKAGEQFFQRIFGQFRDFSLRYSKLLEENEEKMKEAHGDIKFKALRLRAESLPQIF